MVGGVSALVNLEKGLKQPEKADKDDAEGLKNTKEMLQAVLTEASKFASDDLKKQITSLQGEVDGLGRGTVSGNGTSWSPLISKMSSVDRKYIFEAKKVGRVTVTRLLNNNAPIKITLTDQAGNVVAHRPGKPLEYEFLPAKEQSYKLVIQNNDIKFATQVKVITN